MNKVKTKVESSVYLKNRTLPKKDVLRFGKSNCSIILPIMTTMLVVILLVVGIIYVDRFFYAAEIIFLFVVSAIWSSVQIDRISISQYGIAIGKFTEIQYANVQSVLVEGKRITIVTSAELRFWFTSRNRRLSMLKRYIAIEKFRNGLSADIILEKMNNSADPS
ncbi:MAG: hypothetical protein A2Y16_04410 [Tenericutes bacterium GWF2_57_13]|nr:MAG: hypothetical protein A2Y16_04410 [Tenericutes bacterium GWF2_57_13]